MAIFGVPKLRQQMQRIETQTHTNLQRAIATSALQLDRTMKQLIQKGPKTGRVYRRGGITRGGTRGLRALGLRQSRGSTRLFVGANFHRASAPGEPPATDTGRLVSSISPRFADDGLTAYVGVQDVSRVRYAYALEYGSRRIRPRPFVRPTFTQHKDEIQNRLKQAVTSATTGKGI